MRFHACSHFALGIAGGAAGMAIGLLIGNRLSQRRLKTVFALLMLGIALFIFTKGPG